MRTIHNGIEIYSNEDEDLNYGSPVPSDDEEEEDVGIKSKSTFFKNFFDKGENIEDLIDSLDEDVGIEVLDKNGLGFEDVSIETDEELEEEDEQELVDGFTEFLISKGGGKSMILKDVNEDLDSDDEPVTDSEDEEDNESEESEDDGYDDDNDLYEDADDPPYEYQKNYRDYLDN